MNLPVAEHTPCARVARKLAASAALVVLATGVLVLFGWLLDIPSLKSMLPGLVAMKANTAAGFILAGMSLALLGRAARSVRIRRLSQACAGATALLGLLTLSQYLFALNLGIDPVLFREPAGAIKALSPGRMAPSTALNFLLLGSALLLAGFSRGIRIAQPLALLAGCIGLMVVMGYLYGASALCGIGAYTQMAMHTAVTFAILGLGVLLARPAEGLMRSVTSNTMGGLLIRRIMPFVVVLPVVLGWLRVQGEQHGYFDSAFGVALMMIVLMFAAVGVTWWTARTLNRIDIALSFKTMLLEAQSQTSPDGILAVDAEGKSILSNNRFGELWKIPQHILDTRDDGKMLECILGQLKDPVGFGRKVAYLYEHQDEKIRDEIEFADGRFFDRYSSPLVGANGKYYGRIWYFRDITDRRRLEHELRRLAMIAEQAAEGIAVADLDGNLQFANDAWARMHGYESGAELVGKHLSVFHTDEQMKTEVTPFNAAVKRQGHHAGEVGHVRKDGTTFPTQMMVTVLKDERGEPYGLAGFAEDITRRKRAEEERRRLAAILEAAPDFVGFADPKDTHVLYINKAGRLMTGLAPDEDVTKLKIADVHPEWTNRMFAETILPTAARDGLWIGECAFLHRDGHEIPVLMALLAHKTPSGEVEVFSTISRDISERKQAEDAIRQARTEAEQANAAKSLFLANMSHEIRTPMTAILGFTDLIGNSIEGCATCPEHQACPTRGQNKESIQIIRRNGEHLLDLINDILDLSKIEAGKMGVERVPCSPVQVVEEIVSFMRVRAAEKGLSLDARFEFPLPETILSDPARVRQVLINLVGNAVKFTSEGHVEIVVHCITDVQAGRASMAFDVKDTGIGMMPDEIGRLFQPFAQADASTTRQHGGTGLGLAISKRLAEALGGDIHVVSRPGEGSTFTFTLEAALPPPVRMLNDLSEAAARASQQPQSPPAAAVRLCGKVLLAEDGPDNQKLIAMILRQAGADVDLASSGRVAVERVLEGMAAGTPYDAILMDMQMPELDGYEATSKLRASGYRGPVVALTAHAMAGDRQKCIDAGCDDYATKPVDRLGLLRLLARLMGCPPSAPGEPASATTASDEAIASAFRDDPDMVGVIAEFVGQLPERLAQMRQAAGAGLWDVLRRLAHQLKGAGGSYGYACLTEAARELESHANQGDAEGTVLALNHLAHLCERIQAGLALDSVPQNARTR